MQNKMLKKLVAFTMSLFLLFTFTKPVKAEEAYNPYYGGWSNCTWSAWQLVYEATGIALPAWHSASYWYSDAAASGFAVGSEPRANSIGVWYGHVVYVTEVDGEGNIYVKEGGFGGGYNEGWSSGYGSRYGQALIGYIYLDGPVVSVDHSDLVNPDLQNLDQPIRSDSRVQLAIAPELVDADIENIEIDIIRKYDAMQQETVKDEELSARKEVQAEDAKSKKITLNISSPAIRITTSLNPVTTPEPTK